MKKLLFLGLLIWSGCCNSTDSCNCTPPNPALLPETLLWMQSYVDQEYFVFEDENGMLDSLQVTRSTGTEFCGGEECGSDCEVEMATLISSINSDLKFVARATQRTNFEVNMEISQDAYVYVWLNVLEGYTVDQDTNVYSILDDDYEWNGSEIKVLIIDCINTFSCSDYQMTRMVVSEKFGLMEYTTNEGEKWAKVD